MRVIAAVPTELAKKLLENYEDGELREEFQQLLAIIEKVAPQLLFTTSPEISYRNMSLSLDSTKEVINT